MLGGSSHAVGVAASGSNLPRPILPTNRPGRSHRIVRVFLVQEISVMCGLTSPGSCSRQKRRTMEAIP